MSVWPDIRYGVAKLPVARSRALPLRTARAPPLAAHVDGRARAEGVTAKRCKESAKKAATKKRARNLALDLQVLIDNGTFYESPERRSHRIVQTRVIRSIRKGYEKNGLDIWKLTVRFKTKLLDVA